MKLHNVSCPQGCSEAVLSLDTGEGQEIAGKGEAGAEDKRGGGRDRDERLGGREQRRRAKGLGGLG